MSEVKEHAWQTWIGEKVYKTSGKPFKSTLKIATVKGVTVNPWTLRPAFIFEEDDSVVECRTCERLGF